MIIRNDDVSVDTRLDELMRFCGLCDQYGFRIIQGITVLGETHKIEGEMDNNKIMTLGRTRTIFDNEELIDYLVDRNDLIGVHGLWHTHCPSLFDIESATQRLVRMYLRPTYFIPPFNEGDYPETVCGLKVSSGDAQSLEQYLKSDKIPETKIVYTHSWRYGKYHPWRLLDEKLAHIHSHQSQVR